MANKVVFEVVATSKGFEVVQTQQKQLQQNIDKTSKSTKNLTKQQDDNYGRQKQGLIQTANGTKNFSKLSQTIGSGSSGLVGAYATLAANVFAATAAFNALRQAAQVDTLIQGFGFLANASGRTSEVIAGNLRKITDNALSLEDSLRASSIAITSGFSTSQMSELAEVARNASIALGRNLGDSVDRLFRGVAKLEPEILDELGILVRLDSAVESYASRLGKAGTDLTDFERRQAFLNATIDQGTLKYGALTEAVKPNAYDQLAASFSDLTREGIAMLNTFVTPLVSMLASNSGMLLGVLVLFASTIVSTMFPVLTELGQRQMEAASMSKQAAIIEEKAAIRRVEAARKSVMGQKGGGKGVQNVREKLLKNEKVSAEEYRKAILALTKAENTRQKNLDAGAVKNIEQKEKELADVRQLRTEIERLSAAEGKRAGLSRGALVESGKASSSRSLGQSTMIVGSVGGIEGFKEAGKGLDRYRKKLLVTERRAGNFTKKAGFTKWSKAVGFAFKSAGGAARLFGAALLNSIPLIGQIIFLGSMLVGFLMKSTGKTKEYREAQDTLNTVLETYSDKVEQLDKTNDNLENSLKRVNIAVNESQLRGMKLANTIKLTAGVSDELGAATIELAKEMDKEEFSKFNILMQQVGKVLGAVGSAAAEGFGKLFKGAVEVIKVIPGIQLLTMAFRNLFSALPTEDDIKFENFTETIANEAAATYDKLAAKSSIFAKQYKDVFGDGGLQGFIIAKRAEKGMTFSKFIKEYEFAVKTLNMRTGSVNANVQSLGTDLAEVSKQITKINSGLANKNQYDKVADSFDNIGIKIRSITKELGDIDSIDVLSGIFTTAELGTLNQYGITLDSILASLNDDKPGNALDDFGDKWREVANLVRFTSNAIKQNNALISSGKAALSARIEADKLRLKTLNAAKTGDFKMGAQDEAELQKKIAKDKIDAAADEAVLKLEIIDLEFKLMAKKIEMDASLSETEKTRLLEQIGNIAVYKDATVKANEKIAKAKAEAELKAAKANAGQSGTLLDRMGTVSEFGNLDKDSTTAEKVKALQGIIKPLTEDLAKLGPEGEAVNAMASGALLIADSIGVIGTKGEDTSVKLAAVGQAIGAVSSIVAANSKAQIAEIDKQIEAEKKRDGKSAASVAKITAMEKKKDSIARKAFNTNKKLQMAQTVMNTASGMMKAYTDFDGFTATALAAMIGALGAAQLAIISKTQYQGGAQNIEAAASTALSIGKRGNAVDVAGNASGGELAYLRGERGVGSNANNFRPGGAMGRKGYANGGESIVVGERGPEVITPTSPVDITPNFALGGQAQNINFNISAVDGASVQNMLNEQQGNIIAMIRQAANDNGEGFLETVDPTVYGGGG